MSGDGSALGSLGVVLLEMFWRPRPDEGAIVGCGPVRRPGSRAEPVPERPSGIGWPGPCHQRGFRADRTPGSTGTTNN